jgi:hypothetical protein
MKKLLFSALVGAMIISCSRDNDNTNPTTPQTPATNETGILPTKLTSSKTGKADEVSTFSYNGNKLVKATYDNKDEIYTYTGDLITSINNPNGGSYVFNYDSNGNLISEKGESYNGSIKFNENNITYTVNGSTVTAQKISKNYDYTDGTLSSITTSTITYTLDAKKRPIKRVEVSEEKDAAGNITQKENNTFTYQYANHHSLIENIKGMNKLNYSSFAIGGEDSDNIFFPVSYIKQEINRSFYHSGSLSHNNNYTREYTVEYALNTNNYPTKIQFKTKDPATGQYKNSDYYRTIEYNK